MKLLRFLCVTPLLAATILPAQSFGGARLVQAPERVQIGANSPQIMRVAAKKKAKTHRVRSKKKSAAIVGGSALGGAAIGGLAGGGKGAAIGGAASLGKGESVNVPAGAMMEFRIVQPVTIK